jgi:hypothetical protein
MRWFGGRQPAPIGAPAAAAVVIGNIFDPAAILAALDVANRRIEAHVWRMSTHRYESSQRMTGPLRSKFPAVLALMPL